MSISVSLPTPESAIAQDRDDSLSGVLVNLQQRFDKRRSFQDSHSRSIFQHALDIAAATERRLLEQSHRIEYLESLSVTDELTGLYNRRGFTQVLDRVLAAARRYDENGMLGYIDLDGFKAVNDRYGHDAGDALLRHVAHVLTENTRNTDYVARLGGDEFAILFVQAEPLATRARAMKLKNILAKSTTRYRGQRLSVQASIGLSSYSANTNSRRLLRNADSAMYADKHKSFEQTSA